MDVFNSIFNKLDDWRELPNYQLERRSDIFFAHYLPQVLKTKYGQPVFDTLIPEFPVRKGTIKALLNNPKYQAINKWEEDDLVETHKERFNKWKEYILSLTDINKSYKIDYLAFTTDLTKVYLIELKTDINSLNFVQDYYLKAAKYIGIKDLIHGLFDITQATKAKGKYTHLLRKLEDVKLIDSVPGGINDLIKHKKLKDRIPILNNFTKCEIIYIQPTGEEKSIINFSQFSEAIKTNTDKLSIRFTKSLAKWMNKAGE